MKSEFSDIDVEDETDDGEVSIVYDIASYPSDFTLSGIAQMWEDGDIEIPDFQREFVWSIKQSSLLMDSFLCGLPVPPVFFYIDEKNKNLVIDGQQRILSVVYFLRDILVTKAPKVDDKFLGFLDLMSAALITTKIY